MIISPPRLLDGRRWAGLRIGLVGGSFNPPHRGHVHISLMALRALQLDYIWWLVTPHNPLKDKAELLPYDDRLTRCREMAAHPRILVTDLERQMGVNRSYDTIKGLKKAFPASRFVWVTGMDNALNFHRWYRWRDILKEVATAHIARPPAWSLIERCPLRLVESQLHVWPDRSFRAELAPGRTFWLLQKKMLGLSSTQIRAGLSEFQRDKDSP